MKLRALLRYLNPEDIDHSAFYGCALTFAYVFAAMLVFILSFLYFV